MITPGPLGYVSLDVLYSAGLRPALPVWEKYQGPANTHRKLFGASWDFPFDSTYETRYSLSSAIAMPCLLVIQRRCF